jgi:hypothetical protein
MCQSIWDKSEVLLGTLWGTCQELGNSLLGWKVYSPHQTQLEKKTSPTEHPQEKKVRPLHSMA